MKNVMMALGLLLTVGGGDAAAGLVTFASGSGVTWNSDNDAVCGSSASCSGSTVTITPHGLWQVNNPHNSGAVWVSYADTGITGSLAPTGQPDSGKLMSITLNLANAVVGSAINFKIWADDTAGVFLNGVEKKAPNLTQGTCANGPIGCEPGEFYQASNWLATGNDQIRIDVYQVGTTQTAASNPFGVLYYGDYTTPTSVPDGGITLTLLGGGLVGLGRSVVGSASRITHPLARWRELAGVSKPALRPASFVMAALGQSRPRARTADPTLLAPRSILNSEL